MPVYRVPKTGELFFRTSPYVSRMAESPTTLPALRPGRARPGIPVRKHRDGQHHPSPQIGPQRIGTKREHPVQQQPLTPPPSQPAQALTQRSGDAPSTFTTPLIRKSRTGGALRAIAFYTTNDPQKTPAWKRYAEVLVAQGKGQVYGVSGQRAAIKILGGLSDTDISQVYFVGHGFDAAKTGFPAFMFSGHVVVTTDAQGRRHEGFRAEGDHDLLLSARSEPFLRALVPHLSRDRMVTLYLLSCHSGTNNRLQTELASIILQLAPELDLTVLGYKEYYMVALSTQISPRAHLRTEANSPPLSQDVVAPRIPEGFLKYDDPLRSVALDQSDDPISGLFDSL